jgi:hypothetical protein
MAWKPTPKSRLLTAERLREGGVWEKCQYADLKAGDIYRTYAGDQRINPMTFDLLEKGEDVVGFCCADAVRCMDRDGRAEGWMVDSCIGLYADVLKTVRN